MMQAVAHRQFMARSGRAAFGVTLALCAGIALGVSSGDTRAGVIRGTVRVPRLVALDRILDQRVSGPRVLPRTGRRRLARARVRRRRLDRAALGRQIMQVKPDMVGTFEDLIKHELMPAQKKAGTAYRWTYINGPMGGRGFTYLTVTPVTSYAQFDDGPGAQRVMGPGPYAAYQAKLRTTLVSQEFFIQTLQPQLSIISGSTTASPLAVVTVMQVAPGKNDEYTRVMTTDILPNYKKAGVKDFMVYTTNFGDAPQGRVVTVRGINKYADMDGVGLLQRAGLTPEAAAAINARRAAVASGVSNVISRFLPDLSFGAPATRPTSQ